MVDARIKGATYGFAYGDSWGNQAEFQSHAQNIDEHAEFPQLAEVTDDTQMSLYTLYAIMFEVENAPETVTALHKDEDKRNYIRRAFAESYLEFAKDPDNNRAPGMTCMNALSSYNQLKVHENYREEPLKGNEGCHDDSKGCGANMRVGWLGLLPLPQEDIVNLSILQSETTHGHPLALSSSVLTALTVKAIFEKEIISGSGTYLDWAESKTRELADELDLKGSDAPGSWSASYREGLTELLKFIDTIRNNIPAFLQSGPNDDICEFFGGGWVAEEAYINGLLAADYLSDNPVEAVRRLVYTSGDSDSIAAFGGMFIGTEKGFDVYPAEWEAHLENRYTEELTEVTEFLNRVN